MRPNDAATIVIFGSDGQLGFELRRSFAYVGRVIALKRADCDIGCPDAVRAVLGQHRPDVVLNAAAYTAVERAQQDRETALLINGAAPGWLSQITRDLGGLFVHYSTDYVFDGQASRPYTEDDATVPLSVYGDTKLAGEHAALRAGGAVLVLRTAWLAGAHGNNFLKTILARARAQDHLRVVSDQIGTPTTAALVADVTACIVGRHWVGAAHSAFPSGVYHLVADGHISWHGYACEILRVAASRGCALRAGPGDVEACASRDMQRLAPRPPYAVLDTTRLRETFGVHMPRWEAGVHWLLEQLISQVQTHA